MRMKKRRRGGSSPSITAERGRETRQRMELEARQNLDPQGKRGALLPLFLVFYFISVVLAVIQLLLMHCGLYGCICLSIFL